MNEIRTLFENFWICKDTDKETYYKVKESDRIACDHAALIVQAWKLVERRLI